MARWRRWRRRRRGNNGNGFTSANHPTKSKTKLARLKTYAKVAGVSALAASVWYAVETQVLRSSMSFEGTPKHRDFDTDWLDQLTTRVFRNDAYMVGYSEKLGNPLWVTYQVLPKPEFSPRLPRPSQFQSDWRSTRCWFVLPCIEHDDYTESGYDRGHLAPNHVIASRYGQEAQIETFLMTNITPQAPNLNRRAWQRLEEIAANHFADRYAPFTVVTGPIFDDKPKHLPGYKLIAIPKGFYKIFIRESKNGEPPKVLAFVMPQTALGNEDLSQYLVSVRDIEEQTGLDFMHELDDGVEAYVETLIDPQSWDFNEDIANQSARY
ncbi:DNA/RNA non-specific endonuclease [Thiomicrospira sp.]|uniref:DNA/RNA non-specific endonuclease n=1 Tax=Thiomicrospira sp. TaxID=935 RepID=UPI002F95408A